MIWAQDLRGTIGDGASMLWRVPADYRHFREVTTGHTVIMGRKTFESLGSRALPERRCIVVSSHPDPGWRGVERAPHLDAALEMSAADAEPRWIIGGGQLYAQAIDHADLLVVTTVKLTVEGSVVAPHIGPEWHRVDVAPEPSWPPTCISDPEGTWRDVSGDAAWRVSVYRRA
ncbi:dihydrofolate reductase [Nanchangia anserum]|uniref:dihydrofolate reductase n=1 Tax=Nanchangia anserum TaxID=2692125 RepID=A0A8I0GCA4_9ACTO|nr:dihydrofolate reductase [Nanchangia anserum]MBD3688923.1 dihydrofolate reductase [Nanchangia anserum]QOX81188.1 dihydrofolate reductase [Nanchangia anserum]